MLAGAAVEAAREFEFQEDGQHRTGGQAGAARQFVDLNWRRAEKAEDRHAGGGEICLGVGPVRGGGRFRFGEPAIRSRAEAGQNVGGRFGERRALADEIVRAPAARIERRAGDGEDLAVLFERIARGDERARARGGSSVCAARYHRIRDRSGAGVSGRRRAAELAQDRVLSRPTHLGPLQ